MSDLIYVSATELAELIRTGEASSREVVQAHLDRIDEKNDALNAVVERLDEEAFAAADVADDAQAKGISLGPLHGVPITLKECLSIAGKEATCGSPILKGNVPDRDATAVARIKGAGAIPIGRTNLPEWALDFQSDCQNFGRTNNPWNLDRSCGGSSGGEGAAIAAGMSPLGLGSDVGGSIRIPSHFCGVCGIKPTAGRVTITGHVPEGLHPYNSVAPLARDIDDLSLALRIISGPDGSDPTTQPVPFAGSRFVDMEGMRVAYMLGDGVVPFSKATQETVKRAAALAEELGAEVAEAMPPHLETVFPTMNTLYAFDLLPLYEQVWKPHEDELHPQVKDIVALMDPDATLADAAQATQQWRRLRQGAQRFFQRYDLLLCPTLAVPAIPHGVRQTNMVDDQEVMYYMIATLTFTWNLTGNPSVVIPMGKGPEGTPIGIQVVARHWDEDTQFMAAKALLAANGGVPRPPGY